jgi:hypothetical protein
MINFALLEEYAYTFLEDIELIKIVFEFFKKKQFIKVSNLVKVFRRRIQ